MVFKEQGESVSERKRGRGTSLTELGELDPVAEGVEMENGGLAVLRYGPKRLYTFKGVKFTASKCHHLGIHIRM